MVSNNSSTNLNPRRWMSSQVHRNPKQKVMGAVVNLKSYLIQKLPNKRQRKAPVSTFYVQLKSRLSCLSSNFYCDWISCNGTIFSMIYFFFHPFYFLRNEKSNYIILKSKGGLISETFLFGSNLRTCVPNHAIFSWLCRVLMGLIWHPFRRFELNPNWHGGGGGRGHFYPLVLFWLNFVIWIFIKNFHTLLEVTTDSNRINLTSSLSLIKNVPRWRYSSCQWGLCEKLFEIKPPSLHTFSAQN